MFASSKTALTAAFLAMPLFAAPQHLPLATGNTWTYRQHGGDDTFTIRVGVPTLTSDNVYYSLRGYTPKPLLVRFHDDGDLYYLDEDAGRDILLISFQQVKGAWFQAPQRACDEEGQVDATEPALVRIVYRTLSCADTGDQEEQFAANVGMVQRTVNSLIGPRRYDLVSARVGNTTVQTDPGAKLSVSVRKTSDPNHLLATIELSVTGSDPVRLRYLSGQDFDLILRSPSGEVVWKWSDGQVFTPETRDDSTAGRSWTASVPVTSRLGNALPSGNYQLEAWLNTGTDRPQFAATTPVTLGQPR